VLVTIDRLDLGVEAFGVKGLKHMMALKGIGRDQTESKTTPIVQPVNKLQDLVVADGTGGGGCIAGWPCNYGLKSIP